MSAKRERIVPVKTAVMPSQVHPEQKYWRGFANSQLVKEHNAITHISFDQNSPHDFAVTSSTRIQVFSSKTRKVAKSFTRFKDTVFCGEFRNDGKLLVAGDASGIVQIYDAHHPRTLLVSINPSTHPTQVTKFHPTITTQLLTCSDDRVARIYDISQANKPIMSFGEHDDYIRAGSFMPNSPNLVVTGCYDNFIRVFDTRSGSTPIIKFNQGSPVEDLLSTNSTNLISAGDNAVNCWDIVAGIKSRSLNNFTKTVTSLANAGDRGILAGSIDGHVKVFDTSTPNWDVRFNWKFGSGVLACGVSPDHKHLVVGLNSGLLTIRTRKTEPKQVVDQSSKTQKSETLERLLRGGEYKGENELQVIDDRSQSKKLKPFEKLLNQFKWPEALDNVIKTNQSSEMVITCMSELKKRGKVRVSLSNKDENSLEPILTWCLKNITKPRNVNIISDFLMCILEMYDQLISSNFVIEELVLNLQRKVDIEIKKCEQSEKIIGMLELLTA